MSYTIYSTWKFNNNEEKKIILIYIFSFLLSMGNLIAQTWSPDLPALPNPFTEMEKAQQRINGLKLIDSLKSYALRPDIEKIIVVNDDCRFSGDGSFLVSSLTKTKILGREERM